MAHQEEDYLTTSQAAEVLNVSRSWLEKSRMRGEGPPYYKLSPRLVLYNRRSLIDWMEDHRVEPTALRAFDATRR